MDPLVKETIYVLGIAAATFAVIRSLFGFLAWLFPESDELYRAKLDAFFDALDRTSLFELGRMVLQRLISLVRRMFARPFRAYIAVGFASLTLNIVIFFAATSWVVGTHFFYSSGFDVVWSSISRADLGDVLALLLLVGILGTGFDLLSLSITWFLLAKASISTRARYLVEHLLIDILVAVVACMWAYAIFEIVISKYYDEILQHVEDHTSAPEIYLQPTLWGTLQVNKPVMYAVVFLGISAAVPTLLYLAALAPVLILRITPRFMQRALARIIYLITTDSRPVLQQVAIFASSLAALIGAVIGWLRLID